MKIVRLTRSLAFSLLLLSACATTGKGFKSSGLNQIVAGRTTLDQAIADLGARPVDTWQQGDTLLARWAYKGTVATDAVYFRQEVWLRFGADERFIRTEKSINVPMQNHTLTAAQADAARARQQDARPQPASAASGGAVPAAASGAEPQGNTGPIAIPVLPPGSMQPVSGATSSAAGTSLSAPTDAVDIPPGSSPSTPPLLPAGTQVIPGATYPLSNDVH